MSAEKFPIFHLQFPSQYLLCATFLRFQEHYESPKFSGEAFSWEEYMDWYARSRGNFTYTSDWNGFNIPSKVLAAFREGRFDPLTKKERSFLALFDGMEEPFYVIGTHRKGDLATMAHECVHGLYALFPRYREDVLAALREHDTRRLHRILRKMGYAEHVLDDEINAYLTTGLDSGMNGPEVPRIRSGLRAAYREHFGADIFDRKERRRLPRRVHSRRFDPTA